MTTTDVQFRRRHYTYQNKIVVATPGRLFELRLNIIILTLNEQWKESWIAGEVKSTGGYCANVKTDIRQLQWSE